jgi:hypothetical protein
MILRHARKEVGQVKNIDSMMQVNAGSEHGNGRSVSIKSWEFLDQWNKY